MPSNPNVTKAGIHLLSDVDAKAPKTCEVLAVGGDLIAENGTIIKPEVKVGDKVLVDASAGWAITHEGIIYYLLHETELLAIVE